MTIASPQPSRVDGTSADSPTLIDIRLLGSCVDRKAHVLAAFDALTPGGSLVVLNDHMPEGLRRHFEALRPTSFSWTVLDAGPETFRVRIARRDDVAPSPSGG
jgi:uncharacterized protein (DUF2249 family)